jgi:ABC-type Fe3+-citrate transport system substrate-binding protein
MNKLLIVLVFFLIIGSVFVSGCTSMGEGDSEDSSSGDDNSGSEDSNQDSDSKGYNSGITNFKS